MILLGLDFLQNALPIGPTFRRRNKESDEESDEEREKSEFGAKKI